MTCTCKFSFLLLYFNSVGICWWPGTAGCQAISQYPAYFSILLNIGCTSVNFVLSLWICRGVPGPFRNRPDVSSIGPMPGRFWHIAAYLQGCLVFVCYVELFWCYVFFVCTASPVSTATECRNKIVTKTSLRYLSHSAVTTSEVLYSPDRNFTENT